MMQNHLQKQEMKWHKMTQSQLVNYKRMVMDENDIGKNKFKKTLKDHIACMKWRMLSRRTSKSEKQD